MNLAFHWLPLLFQLKSGVANEQDELFISQCWLSRCTEISMSVTLQFELNDL